MRAPLVEENLNELRTEAPKGAHANPLCRFARWVILLQAESLDEPRERRKQVAVVHQLDSISYRQPQQSFVAILRCGCRSQPCRFSILKVCDGLLARVVRLTSRSPLRFQMPLD